MASSNEYLQFMLEQLTELKKITCRTMIREFIIYYRSIIVGGIYDDILLFKPSKATIKYTPSVSYVAPYKGPKEMLGGDEDDNKDFLTDLF